MQSPAASFTSDIVGAAAVIAGKATTPSGVKVNGDQLTITLTRAAPDFLSRIAMPFFCAVPENLPIDSERRQAGARRRPLLLRGVQPQRSRSSSSATRTTAAPGRSAGTR